VRIMKKDISMKSRQKPLALFVALAVCAVPLAAQAQRKSPLADAPAIRKRLELRSGRFELGAGAASTLNQDFYHSIFINVKLGFHITDWLAISAFGGFAAANLTTGFQDRVVGSLNDTSTIPREPSKGEAQASLNKISQMLGAQLEFTPFTGKYSMFGKLFAHYDLYLLGGIGALNLTAPSPAANACTDSGADRSCVVTGLKVGLNFGVGIHSYINDFMALNLELRDIMVENNPAGRDVNGDTHANAGDEEFQSTYVVTLNLLFVLPATAHISN
jgi:outer membrane beta-barrel protein